MVSTHWPSFFSYLLGVVCLIGIFPLCDSQAKKKTKVDEYSYSYEYEGGQDYSYKVPVTPVDRRIPCYSCSYLVEEDGTKVGMEHCNEPFNPAEIPEVMCDGSCVMIHRWIKKPTEFVISRQCKPDCKEVVTEDKYIRCCSTKLCNGFNSAGIKRGLSVTFQALILSFAFLQSLGMSV